MSEEQLQHLDEIYAEDDTPTEAQLDEQWAKVQPLFRSDAERQFAPLKNVKLTAKQRDDLIADTNTTLLWACSQLKVHENLAYRILRTFEEVLDKTLEKPDEPVTPAPEPESP